MLEAVLIELLRRKNIITENEVKTVTSIRTLYDLLGSVEEIQPLSEGDVRVVGKLEKLIKDKNVTLNDKIIWLKRAEKKVNDELLKELIKKLKEKLGALINDKKSNS